MENRKIVNENVEIRTDIPLDPRIGVGHPNLDPMIPDKPVVTPEPPKIDTTKK